MNKFYTQTNIPIPKVDYKLIWPNEPTDATDGPIRYKTYPNQTMLWDEHTTELLLSCGLVPSMIRIFRWLPNRTFNWHIDGSLTEVSNFAINWVLDGTGEIEWSSRIILPKPNSNNKHPTFGSLPSRDGDYELVDCRFSGHGCLVNTTIPHRVVNKNSIHRITVSIHFGNSLTYEQVAEKLIAAGLVI
jgi:hypothetical protein